MNKNLLAKRIDEALARMFPPSAGATRIAELERENRELREKITELEIQLMYLKAAAREMLEQKDAEITRLYAEAVQARELSPFQFGLSMPWAKN